MKFKVCRGITLFIEPPMCSNNATTCLKHSQLVNYYNELVIQMRIAERLLNTSITTEIREEKRNEVEKNETKIIELLRGNILPLLNTAVSIANYLYTISPYAALYPCSNYIHYILFHVCIAEYYG